jgi:hypothetical protein
MRQTCLAIGCALALSGFMFLMSGTPPALAQGCDPEFLGIVPIPLPVLTIPSGTTTSESVCRVSVPGASGQLVTGVSLTGVSATGPFTVDVNGIEVLSCLADGTCTNVLTTPFPLETGLPVTINPEGSMVTLGPSSLLTFTTVPEPGTLLLLGSSLAVFGLRRRARAYFARPR